MPTSYHVNPQSILDVGVGFGKWGFLFREYLDIMAGRVWPGDWQIKINGMEIYDKYINEYKHIYDYIYDIIYTGDCCELIDLIINHDLIFMSDVLEHIEKGKAILFLEAALKKCKHFILNVPIGNKWGTQGPLYGNENEAHISIWEDSDFSKYKKKVYKQYICNGKPIMMYVFRGEL
jgi:hypothetical protein